MATSRILAQLSPDAGVVTDAYVGQPGLINVRVFVSNTGPTQLKYRIGIAPGGAADDPLHWFINDEPLEPEGSLESSARTPPLLLAENDVVRVYTDIATLNVMVNGPRRT